MASKPTKKTTSVIVSRRRDGDNSPIYSCVKGTDGETVSTKIPLDVEVLLDDNTIKSIKRRTEMVRKSAKAGGERLEQKPTYLIEKV